MSYGEILLQKQVYPYIEYTNEINKKIYGQRTIVVIASNKRMHKSTHKVYKHAKRQKQNKEIINTTHTTLRAQPLYKVHHGQGLISYKHSNPLQKIIHKGLFNCLTYFSILSNTFPFLPFQNKKKYRKIFETFGNWEF